MPSPTAVTAFPLAGLPGLDPTAVRAAATTRRGGVSTGPFSSANLSLTAGDTDDAVLTNRRRAAEAFGAPLEDFVFGRQVHGRTVTVAHDDLRGRGAVTAADALPATDSLVTTTPGLVLAVLVADCVPVVLHDPDRGVLAVAHAGWRGLVRGVLAATVDAMVELGGAPGAMVASIGPAIGAGDYQVGEDVAAAARPALGKRVDDVLHPDGARAYRLDVAGAAEALLTSAGLEPSRIHRSGLTTGPGTPFYSHRLEGPTGRFAVFARLLDGDAA